jgi:hypothetical protein
VDDQFLEHYGVKGMKWGVIHDDPLKGSSPSKEEFATAIDKLNSEPQTTAQRAKRIASAKQMSAEKFGETPSDPKDKASTNHTAVKVAVGLAAAGLIIYGANKALKGKGGKSELSALADLESKLRPSVGPTGLTATVTEKLKASKFKDRVTISQNAIWGSPTFLTKDSFERPELVLPAGHVFHRVSKVQETGFLHMGTYCTPTQEDFHRYVATTKDLGISIPPEKLFHVTMVTSQPIRIAPNAEVVAAFREHMKNKTGVEPTLEQGLKALNHQTGKVWSGSEVEGVFKILKSKGFGGIYDEMDAGVVGQNPLVLFDHESVSVEKAVQIGKAGVKQALSAITELPNRRP